MLKSKINIVVAGATGYVGLDLIKLLASHPKVNIKYLCATKAIGKNINFFGIKIKKKLPKISNLNSVKWNSIDLLFLSLPSGEAQKLVKKLYNKYNGLKFIDLSADFRLKNKKTYKKNYKKKHFAVDLINKALYSVSELSKDRIAKFRIIANPGCYPTSIQIPLVPLLENNLINKKNIIIDSKSGYSGAGKNYKKKFRIKNFESTIYAYAVENHRHVAEINQQFSKISNKINFTFNPHLIPTYRGMLSSIYLTKKKNISLNQIVSFLKRYYKKDPFIKIQQANKPIGTEKVLNTNKCEISVCQSKNSNRIIIFSAIDNLVKGAAGQAVQNMNVLYKFSEKIGLK